MPLFVLLGLYTGRRKEAILSLRWPQVNFEAKRSISRSQVENGRTSEEDRPNPPSASRRARRRGSELGYVLHVDGRRIGDIKKGFAAACERAGLENVTPHTLRHTAATWLMQAGTDVWEAAVSYLWAWKLTAGLCSPSPGASTAGRWEHRAASADCPRNRVMFLNVLIELDQKPP